MTGPELHLSRRTLLSGGVAALVLSACGTESATSGLFGGPGTTATASSAPPLASAEASAWIAAAGSTFMVGGHPMKLAGVELVGPAGGRPEGLRQQGFIAAFDMLDGGQILSDRTYTISHATIPTFDIHLTSNLGGSSRMYASFN